MFLAILRLLLAVLLGILLPISFLLVTPIYPYRYVIAKLVQHWHPAYGKILTATTTNMGVEDITTKPMWTLVIAVTVKGKPGFEEFKRRFVEKIVFAKNKNEEFQKPELQQYVSQKFGFLFWKWDKEFRIENHIHQNVDGVEYNVLNKEVLQEIVENLVYKPFTPNRSPWELIFLKNYDNGSIQEDGEPQNVVLLRIHHVIADGFSILKMFLVNFWESNILDVAVSKHQTASENRRSAKPIGHRVMQLIAPIYTLIRISYDMAYAVINVVQYNANVWHLPEDQLKRSYNNAFTEDISVQDVRYIKNLCKCSFSTVVLAAYTGALRRFMMEAGYTKMPSNILCGMALPVTNHPDDKLRNHASAILVRLPTGNSDPLERLRLIEKNLQKIKTGSLATFIYYNGIMVGSLFAWMVRSMAINRNTTVIGSIFPGPNQSVTTEGFTYTGVTYAGGFTRGNVGLGLACMSCCSKLSIGIAIDEGIVPKSRLPASKMLDYIIQELEELKIIMSSEPEEIKVVHIV